jgi:hypothetical protein
MNVHLFGTNPICDGRFWPLAAVRLGQLSGV